MCTSVRIRATNGATVVGRTMEFAVPLESQIAVIPRGFGVTSGAPGGVGAGWTIEHGIVGASAFGEAHQIADGMNEQGLNAAGLYMPGFCEYTPAEGRDPSTLLEPAHMVTYVLGTCATTDEAIAAMQAVAVWPSPVPQMGFAPPLHLVLHDAGGHSAVIEWRDGEMLTFENPIGVATNAPHLDWHYTNLRNFITLSERTPPPVEIEGVSLPPLGQGVGLIGLPADSSPPSRFVRAVAYATAREPAADGAALEMEMLHLINNFDIPHGTVVSTDGTAVEHTRYTTIANLTDGHYIVRYSSDPTPRLVDLGRTDFTGEPRQVSMPGGTWLALEV